MKDAGSASSAPEKISHVGVQRVPGGVKVSLVSPDGDEQATTVCAHQAVAIGKALVTEGELASGWLSNLRALAEGAAERFGYGWYDEETFRGALRQSDAYEDVDAAYLAEVDPEAVLRLIGVVELAGKSDCLNDHDSRKDCESPLCRALYEAVGDE